MGRPPKDKKKYLRGKCDTAWFRNNLKEQCEVCGAVAHHCHHFFQKGNYPQLRYNNNNAISLCSSCHIKHHFQGDPTIHQTIVEGRGQSWYQSLVEESKEKIKTRGIKDYKEILEGLTKN